MSETFQKTKAAITARISTGAAVQAHSSLVLPRICGPSVAPIADDEQHQADLDEQEDPARHSEDQPVDVPDLIGVGRGRLGRRDAAVARDGRGCGDEREHRDAAEDENGAAHGRWHSMSVSEQTRVQLPGGLTEGFEVFVNGVRQEPGRDFRREGDELVFNRHLAREGRLGFWRWLSLFLGVAGTYRQNDSVDVIYEAGGRRVVANGLPLKLEG
jgi:hypothetical protein